MADTVQSVERKIRNRRRDLLKKLVEIAETEEKKSKGEPIDENQEASIVSKPAVEGSLKEVDYILDSLFPSKESVPTKAESVPKRDDKALTENIKASEIFDVPAAAASHLHYQYKLLLMCKVAYILWDLENGKIPQHFDTADVLPALSMFLNSFGFKGKLIVEPVIAKKSAGDRCPFEVIEALENMGVNVQECKEVVPQASDLVIQSRIDELAQRKEKAVVVVMAGDGGYLPSLLAAEQYERLVIFVCYPYGKLNSDLKQKFRPFGIICFEDLIWNYATIDGHYKSLKDVQMENRTQKRQAKIAGSRSAFPLPTDPFTLTVEEKLKVALTRDGGLSSFDMRGTLSLHILNQEDGLVRVQIETGGNPEISFTTHPVINQSMFKDENILGRKTPDEPFRTGDIVLMRWRMRRADESMVPLTINCCWPAASGNETYVSLEYKASSTFDLTNVVISVPLPALREAPSVRQCDGEWRYDPINSALEWSIHVIDNSNRSGSMKFVVPPVDSSVFFPISVQFAATSTYSGLKVTGMIPLIGGGGATPRFVQRTQLVAQSYQVV